MGETEWTPEPCEISPTEPIDDFGQKRNVSGVCNESPDDDEQQQQKKKQRYAEHFTPDQLSKLSSKTQEDHAKCHGRAVSSDEDGDGPFGDQIRREPYTAEVAMQSTSKIPPYWTPTLEKKGYPFSVWKRDIELWCAGTELPPHACGPAIAMRQGGIAREMVREVDLSHRVS